MEKEITTSPGIRLDEQSLAEERLFRTRQALVHRAIREERVEGLRDAYLEVRHSEEEIRCERLKTLNEIHPGRFYKDHGKAIGSMDPRRRAVYLVMMLFSMGGLIYLLFFR
ncbi:MAG: hypothetical protein HUU36_11905 [Candidatus Omnitrophica bacterium]|nr:hypothetical protein [Candidatus Omnitrophota bacterium]